MGTTVSTELVHHGERRDQVGRMHVPVERQRELVDAYRASGLTRRRFARQEGIRYTTFCHWVKQADKAAGTSEGAAAEPKRLRRVGRAPRRINFAEVTLPASATRGLEVCLTDGTILRGERVEELAALTRALRS
jgi:transposase-like protein